MLKAGREKMGWGRLPFAEDRLGRGLHCWQWLLQ